MHSHDVLLTYYCCMAVHNVKPSYLASSRTIDPSSLIFSCGAEKFFFGCTESAAETDGVGAEPAPAGVAMLESLCFASPDFDLKNTTWNNENRISKVH